MPKEFEVVLAEWRLYTKTIVIAAESEEDALRKAHRIESEYGEKPIEGASFAGMVSPHSEYPVVEEVKD